MNNDKMHDQLENLLQSMIALAATRKALESEDQNGIREHFTNFNKIHNNKIIDSQAMETLIVDALSSDYTKRQFTMSLEYASIVDMSAACFMMASLILSEDDKSLCDATAKWCRIFELHSGKDALHDTFEMILSDKQLAVSNMMKFHSSLDAQTQEMHEMLNRKEGPNVHQAVSLCKKLKDLAFSREWANDLPQEKILEEIGKRIEFCEKFIEQIVMQPEQVQKMHQEVLVKYSIPSDIVDLLPSFDKKESQHAAIGVHEEILKHLREWKEELVK